MKGENTVDDIAICGYLCVHEETVRALKQAQPSRDAILSLSNFYKAFGDETRMRILCLLLENELCVCDIAALLSMTVSAVSHQLRYLKEVRLVTFRREGKTVFYSLLDAHVKTVVSQGLLHVAEPS